MQNVRRIFRLFLFCTLISTLPAMAARAADTASASSSDQMRHDVENSLQTLIKTNPAAAELSKSAKAILVFPNIVKAGLIFGGSYGEGGLKEGQAINEFYNFVSASWGFQAGAQSYAYAMFLMNDKALQYLRDSKGWEIGVGPTVAILDEGAAKNFSSTTARDDAYGFIFDQQGIMASASLEGTKITKIKQP